MGCSTYDNIDYDSKQKEDYLTRTIFESIMARKRAQIQAQYDMEQDEEEKRERNLLRQQALLNGLDTKGPKSYIDNLIKTEIPKMEFGMVATEEELVKDLNDRDCDEYEEGEIEEDDEEKKNEEAKKEEEKNQNEIDELKKRIEEMNKKEEEEKEKENEKKKKNKKERKRGFDGFLGKKNVKVEEGNEEEKKEEELNEDKKEDEKKSSKINSEKNSNKEKKSSQKEGEENNSEVKQKKQKKEKGINLENEGSEEEKERDESNREKLENEEREMEGTDKLNNEEEEEEDEFSQKQLKKKNKDISDKEEKKSMKKKPIKKENEKLNDLMKLQLQNPSYADKIKRYKYPKKNDDSENKIEFPSSPTELIISVIGDEKSGKSSFIKKYIRNTFEEAYQKTEKIDTYDEIETEVDSKKIKLIVLDTPPLTKIKNIRLIQEKGINKSHIIIYIVDINDEHAEFKVRLMAQSFEFNFKQIIVVIGNKSDKVSIYANKNRDYIDDYCYGKRFLFEVISCKDTVKEEIENFVNNKIIKEYLTLYNK